MSDEDAPGPRFGPGSIPVTMKSGNIELQGKSAQIDYSMQDGSKLETPSLEEIRHYQASGKVCGACKFFDASDTAKREIRREQFYTRLIREEGWKLKHLGSTPDTHGLCGMRPGTLTGTLHKACDQFRQNEGLVKIGQKAR